MLLPGPARPPPAPQSAQHPGLLRRQVEPPGQLLCLLYCTVLVCSKEIAALTDFSESPSVPDDAEWTLLVTEAMAMIQPERKSQKHDGLHCNYDGRGTGGDGEPITPQLDTT